MDNKNITVISCFDGMSCGRIALDRSGFTDVKYLASEIDKKAILVATHNYPDNTNLGSITEWRGWDIEWSKVDLLIGGSPCQGFSSAGKHGGTLSTLSSGEDLLVCTREDYLFAKRDGAEFHSQSYLFWEYVLLLDHIRLHNPDVKFLLENVKMKGVYVTMISNILGCEPLFINSASFSAQNRQRLYWCNWEVQPFVDNPITVNDILDDRDFYSTRAKSYCIDANYGKGTNFKRYFYRGSRQLVLEKDYYPELVGEDTANEVMKADGGRWRKLSISECERLQTVPVGYTDTAGSYAYHMLGNGWTVDVISHILTGLKS